MAINLQDIIDYIESNRSSTNPLDPLIISEAAHMERIRNASSPTIRTNLEAQKGSVKDIQTAARGVQNMMQLRNKKDWIVECLPDGTAKIKFGSSNAAAAAPAAPPPKKIKKKASQVHTYSPPPFMPDIVSMLKAKNPIHIFFVGPTGCGKTECVYHLAKPNVVTDIGYEIYRINCSSRMKPTAFFGGQTVKVDKATKQNEIVFLEGVICKWAKQGLDENGEPIPGAKPGILYIDEAGAMPADIGMLLNRLLDSGLGGERMSFALEDDGGREIKAHPEARIVFSANTNCGGTQGMGGMQYAAQRDMLDLSTRKRFSAIFRFGYDRKAELNILEEKIGNESTKEVKVIEQMLKFRDLWRSKLKERKSDLRTPFTTRDIVKIADIANVFLPTTDNVPVIVSKTLYYTLFEQLSEPERVVANELAFNKLGVDIMTLMTSGMDDYDMM